MQSPVSEHGDRSSHGGFLPTRRFYSPEFLDFEKERLWPRVWHLVGRAAEIPNSGDWLTYDLHDLSLLLIRQADGTISGFHNVCPHRGNRLLDGRGHSEAIRCSFHCWTFDIAGQLQAAPGQQGFPAFSKRDFGLRPLHVEVVTGFVFAHPAPEPEPITNWLGGIRAELELYHFEDMACFMRRRIELASNWKTCLDAFQEVYHVRTVHPQLIPGLKAEQSTFDFFGHHSMMMNPNGSEAERGTGTPDDPETHLAFRKGKAAGSNIDISHLEESRITANYQYHLFPNITFNTHATGCQLFRFVPHEQDPQRCAVDILFLERVREGSPRPREAVAAEVDTANTTFGESLRDFELPPSALSFGADLVDTYAIALDQDFALVPRVQRGLRSPGLQVLSLSSQERRILHWNAALDGFLEGPNFAASWRTQLAND